jgi:hypothetical protein
MNQRFFSHRMEKFGHACHRRAGSPPAAALFRWNMPFRLAESCSEIAPACRFRPRGSPIACGEQARSIGWRRRRGEREVPILAGYWIKDGRVP